MEVGLKHAEVHQCSCADDKLWWHYSNSTYTSTNVTGSAMVFRWEGNDIEIFGAKREQ